MQITRLDHLVLTVADIDRTARFYVEVLGMEHVRFGDGRHALRFGQQKINVHPAAHPIDPTAAAPTPGSADLCLVIAGPLQDAVDDLRRHGIEIEEGIVSRTGALGPIDSIYVRDPDGNLIELSAYPVEAATSWA